MFICTFCILIWGCNRCICYLSHRKNLQKVLSSPNITFLKCMCYEGSLTSHRTLKNWTLVQMEQEPIESLHLQPKYLRNGIPFYAFIFFILQAAPMALTRTQEVQKHSGKGNLLSVITKVLEKRETWEEIQPANNYLRHKRAIKVQAITSR